MYFQNGRDRGTNPETEKTTTAMKGTLIVNTKTTTEIALIAVGEEAI